ncbi:MAG TPA: GNAT family N-acetyltransferase [Alphaproteobacteria bacterium]|nr:GNAT family N-acetyltransferase [Alphaproteobacteria bacterium]
MEIDVVRSRGDFGDDRLVADAERVYLADSERDVPLSMVEAAAQHRNLFVAYDDDTPAALSVVTRFFERPFLSLLIVRKEWRRKGVANLLLDTIEEATAPSRLFTSTNKSNKAMQTLLERRGYVRRGEVDGLDPEDAEIFLSLR